MVLHHSIKNNSPLESTGLSIPNYQRNNLVNLMSSILHGFGGKSQYNDFSELTREIKEAQNVVLLVLDGVGADSLKRLEEIKKKFGKHSFLFQHQYKILQTVFLSTTTAVVTTFYTGLAPQEHGLLAWWLYLKEFKDLVCILRFKSQKNKNLKRVPAGFSFPQSIFEKLTAGKTVQKVKCYCILKKSFFSKPYNKVLSRKTQQIGINNFNGLCRNIQKSIKSMKSNKFRKNNKSRKNNNIPQKKYLYAYWGDFDDFSHYYGKEHHKSLVYLHYLDQKIKELAKTLKALNGSNTLLLVTADHGQITVGKKNIIYFNQHPLFKECLLHPPTGEPRAVFCSVKPEKRQFFEQYVHHIFGKYCTLHRAEELVEKKYFGLFEAHPHLRDRLGDYILLAKKNYAFEDTPPKQGKKSMIGFHGGLSTEEMFVPLIKVKL